MMKICKNFKPRKKNSKLFLGMGGGYCRTFLYLATPIATLPNLPSQTSPTPPQGGAFCIIITCYSMTEFTKIMESSVFLNS